MNAYPKLHTKKTTTNAFFILLPYIVSYAGNNKNA